MLARGEKDRKASAGDGDCKDDRDDDDTGDNDLRTLPGSTAVAPALLAASSSAVPFSSGRDGWGGGVDANESGVAGSCLRSEALAALESLAMFLEDRRQTATVCGLPDPCWDAALLDLVRRRPRITVAALTLVRGVG